MRLKTLIIFISLVTVFTACGGGKDDPNGSGKGASVSPSPLASGQTSSNPLAGQGVPASPGPGASAGTSRPCDPVNYRSVNAGLPGGTYIRAVTRGKTRWGPGCNVLNPGDRCEVQWDGAYNLQVGTEAHLRFQAWAKGKSEPIKELSAGPLPPENSFRRLIFPVTIPDAKEVAFRIVLLDQTKRPVAISDAFGYAINCPPGRT